MPQKPNPLAPSSARPTFDVNAPPQLLTGREAACYTGVNYYLLMRKAAAGEIPRVKWGDAERNVRFRRTDLDRWVASLPLAEGAVRAKPPGQRPTTNGDGPDSAA